MKNILVISIGYPHPSKGASNVIFYSYLSALRNAAYKVTHLLLVPPDEVCAESAKEYLEAIKPGSNFQVCISEVPRIRHTIRRGLNLFSSNLTNEVVAHVLDAQPDATVCLDIHSVMIARKLGLSNLVIWLGDLTFQTAFYHALYDIKSNVWNLLGLAKSLTSVWLWKRCYRATLRDERNVIVSSESSVAALERLGVSSKYQPYPWPASEKCNRRISQYSKPTFIMFGTLSALGSRSAFDFMLKSVHPQLVNKWGRGNFSVLIAGMRSMPDWVSCQIEGNEEYKFLGFIDDLTAEVSRCHAVLAPISVPVGNRSRILTAMSMGALVIAHENTALGNPELESGKNCLLASSPEDFAKHMIFSFEQPDSANFIGETATETFVGSFEPSRASRGLLAQLDIILAEGGHAF